jgi:hypothetical protein
MWNIIKSFYLEAICGGILSGFIWLVRWVRTYFVKEHKEIDSIKSGVLALLHYRLFVMCEELIKKGSVSVENMRHCDYIYKSYTELGGNGVGTELYNRVKSLKIEGGGKSE